MSARVGLGGDGEDAAPGRPVRSAALLQASNTDPPAGHQDPGVDGDAHATPGAEAPAAPAGAAAAASPRPAFAEVYDGHFKAIWLGLRRFGVWDRDLEDAAHDVFIVVHRRLADYDPARPLRPWLLGIAARVASEYRRKSQHRHEVVSEDVEAESSRLPTFTPAHGVRADRALDDKERRELLHRALDTLDFDRRTVLVLHDIEGHAMPDIALALEVNVNTLYARLRQGRFDLKAAVESLTKAA